MIILRARFRSLLVLALWLGPLGCAASRVTSQQFHQLRVEPTSCAAAPSTDSTVYDTTQISEHPVARTVPKLQYPPQALQQRIHGRAVVAAVVDPAGTVEPASVTIVVSADPLLDAEARRIVSLATFWPGCRDGQAVRARIAIPIAFGLSADRAAVGFAVLAGLWAGIMAAVLQ